MPTRAFESIRKIVEDFFGGATFSLVREDTMHREAEQGDNVLVKRITTELDTYHFTLKRSGLPFTVTERKIADELAEAFRIFSHTEKKVTMSYISEPLCSPHSWTCPYPAICGLIGTVPSGRYKNSCRY